MFLWINGQYVPADKPVIRIRDQGFRYGYGLFETIRIYPDWHGAGQPFRLIEHLNRLSTSAKKLNIHLTVSSASFKRAINRLIKLNNISSGRLDIIVTAGEDERGDDSTCIIETGSIEDYSRVTQDGIKVNISPYQRSVESPLVQHKTLNYLENILFQNEAKRRNIFEYVFTNTNGEITGGIRSNIFIVSRKKRLLTPPLRSNVFPGITRKIIFGLCTAQGLKIRERIITEDDLLSAEEIFLTGSLIEIVPVISCDGNIIGGGTVGPVTRSLQNGYQRLIEVSPV